MSDCPPGYLDEPVNGHNQASEISAGTGGLLFNAVDETAVSDAIAAALAAIKIPVTVAMASDCTSPISTTFAPASQVVNAGDDAVFTETISVTATPAQQGQTYQCDDWATVNGTKMADSTGNVILEHKTITVPDTTPPTAVCTQTTNPTGNKVPTSGPSAGRSGQNPDGFYQLLVSDNVAVASIVIRDSASAFVSGSFASGDKVKITQAPGVTPSDTRPGPGVIVSMLRLNGDAILRVTDTSGNVTEVTCLVPPPPK